MLIESDSTLPSWSGFVSLSSSVPRSGPSVCTVAFMILGCPDNPALRRRVVCKRSSSSSTLDAHQYSKAVSKKESNTIGETLQVCLWPIAIDRVKMKKKEVPDAQIHHLSCASGQLPTPSMNGLD